MEEATRDMNPSAQQGFPAGGGSGLNLWEQHEAHVAGKLPPMRVVQNGDLLDIAAVVDLEGLRKLKKLLDSYEQILVMMAENGSTEADGTPL